MPLYEYKCEACGQRFEKIRKFSDPELETCDKCGKGPVQRLMSSPAIQFKGTGWYITDYASKGKSGSDSSSSSTSTPATSDSKTSTPSTEGSSGKSETSAPATKSSSES